MSASGFVCQGYCVTVDVKGTCFMHLSDREPSHSLVCSLNGKFFRFLYSSHSEVTKAVTHSGHAKGNGHVYTAEENIQKHSRMCDLTLT